MARRLIVAFFLAGIPMPLAGCGTFENTRSEGEGGQKIYGGVRLECQTLGKTDPPGLLMLLADLPLSLIGDTVTLPFTVPVSVWRAIESKEKSENSIDKKIAAIQIGQSQAQVYEQLGYPEESSTSGPPGAFIKTLDYWKLGVTVLVDSKGRVIDISRSKKKGE